jgi:hypothetical protein
VVEKVLPLPPPPLLLLLLSVVTMNKDTIGSGSKSGEGKESIEWRLESEANVGDNIHVCLISNKKDDGEEKTEKKRKDGKKPDRQVQEDC